MQDGACEVNVSSLTCLSVFEAWGAIKCTFDPLLLCFVLQCSCIISGQCSDSTIERETEVYCLPHEFIPHRRSVARFQRVLVLIESGSIQSDEVPKTAALLTYHLANTVSIT